MKKSESLTSCIKKKITTITWYCELGKTICIVIHSMIYRKYVTEIVKKINIKLTVSSSIVVDKFYYEGWSNESLSNESLSNESLLLLVLGKKKSVSDNMAQKLSR